VWQAIVYGQRRWPRPRWPWPRWPGHCGSDCPAPSKQAGQQVPARTQQRGVNIKFRPEVLF
jgi:hypothetical protein